MGNAERRMTEDKKHRTKWEVEKLGR